MRFYRLLLRLYPVSFRAEYGEEMCAVFAARRRDGSTLGLWTSGIRDILTNAVAVHIDLLRQDLRWTVSVLGKSPAFAVTAIVLSMLGIGATTSAFALLNHVLIRPLPFSHPDQLVWLKQDETKKGSPRNNVTPPNLADWRTMSSSFSSMGAYVPARVAMTLSGHGEPLRIDAILAGSDLFTTLGVQPVVGRRFTAGDEGRGTPSVVLISHGLATALFASSASAVDHSIRLDDLPYAVVGVMPPGFVFPYRDVDVWLPLRGFPAAQWTDRTNHILDVVARLKPDVSLRHARADVDLVAAQLEQAYPKENENVGIAVASLRDVMAPQSRMLVVVVFGAASCVMLIACTNLANLLLARAVGRRQELAVRRALGAGRERLVRQLFTESLVVAVAGGGLGVLLASLAIPLLALLVPAELPMSPRPEMDWRVLVFAATLTLTTSVVFGVLPAIRASSGADVNGIRSRIGAGGGVGRLRAALVFAEVACTVALLVASGLLMKAMWRVQGVDPGFRSEGVLTLQTALPVAMSDGARLDFYSRVLQGVRSLPGVTSAAYITFLPMTFSAGNLPVTVPGSTTADEVRAHLRFISPDYFRTLGVPQLTGRDVSEGDEALSLPVTVISRSLAERLWPGLEVIGRRMAVIGVERTVIGVVGDVAVRGLEEESLPQMYFPAKQLMPNGGFYAPKDLVVRTAGDPLGLAPALRAVISGVNPQQPIANVRLLDDVIALQTASRRTQLTLLGSFAAVAFLLAGIGIYGLLSFAVSTRRQEVGVRMALGADRRNVLTMFLRQGVVLGLAGVAAGVPMAFVVGRSITSLLFGVAPGDPTIYLVSALLALALTVIGSVRPALRAASVDPAATIRSE